MTLGAEIVLASTEIGMAAANFQNGGPEGDGDGLSWESYKEAWQEHAPIMFIGHGLWLIGILIGLSGSGRRRRRC